MRTAEEILSEAMDGDHLYTAFLNFHPDWLMKKSILAVQNAQKESWNEAVDACAKIVPTLPIENIPIGMLYFEDGGQMPEYGTRINSDFILKLKK